MKPFILEEVSDESLDAVLSLNSAQKTTYFTSLIKTYYPQLDESSTDYEDILECYIASFYVEKIYRTNRFFNEKFTMIYTTTGLIRDIILDRYYCDDNLITH